MNDKAEHAEQYADKKPEKDGFGKLMNQISKDIAVGAVRKDQMAELGKLEANLRAAGDQYDAARYAELVQRWREQDRQIAELLTLWRARPGALKGIGQVRELYDDIAALEKQMADDPLPADDGKGSLFTRRAQQQLKRDVSYRQCERAREQLSAWDKLAQTLDKTLGDNAKGIADAEKLIAQLDVPTLAYDLYFKLVPVHLHIKPDDEEAEVELDPDEARLLEVDGKLVYALPKPLPSLIKPALYGARYMQEVEKLAAATSKLADATGALAAIDAASERTRSQIVDQRNNLDKAARAILSNLADGATGASDSGSTSPSGAAAAADRY